MEGKEASLNSSSDLVVDRISALPDSILGAILSLLPTKNAVATSALSKRWEFLWKIVHNLDFHYYVVPKLYVDADNMRFSRFVDRVMLLHDGGSLNRFSLLWHARTISSSHVISWINMAITKYVHGLYLSVDYGGYFDIPISGFNCDSLRSLELSYIRFVSDATAVCLPRLESMKLDGVYFVPIEACEKLISGCPMLQYLYLSIYLYPDDGIVEELAMPLSVFSRDSLRSLELFGDISVPATIVVCLPHLEKLKLNYVYFESEEACEKLISGCPKLQYLYLGTETEEDEYLIDNGDDYFTCLISSASLRHLDIYISRRKAS